MKCRCLTLVVACIAGQLFAQTKAGYQSTVLGQSPSNYFTFDGGFASLVNPSVLMSDTYFGSGGFTYDQFGNPTNSVFYVLSGDELSNETDPLVNTSGTTNGPINKKGSLSFLFRSLSGLNVGGQRWLFDGRKLQVPTATAGTEFHNALALYFENETDANSPNSLKLEFGDETISILQPSNIVFSTWYYFALTWDEARVPNKAIWYLGIPGQALQTGMTTNATNAVAGEANGLFIGNRSTTGGAFRSPGNGRIDEFALWARELSSTEISNQFAQLPTAPSVGVMVTNVIVDDTFADGDRAATGPLQASWWSSSSDSGNSIEAYTNQLGLISGTSGRGIHGTFTPQDLGIGDTIRATYTFTTPATVGTARSTAFKIGMMDFNNAGLAADLASSSSFTNVLYTNLPGYMADYDVNTGATADTSIRKHQVPNTSGRFLGTTGEWDSKGNSADAGYVFTPNTEYVGVFSVTRSDFDSVDVFSSLSQGGVLMDSNTEGDSSEIANHFGMLGFWVNSSTFGSTTTAGETEDNGITFSHIKVEVITPAPPTLSIAQAGSDVVLSWLTAGSAGFNLESASSLTPPITWSSNGPPPVVVGNSYVVTNTATDSGKYYRLAK